MEMNNPILGEHLPCFLCGQRFYEKNGRCEWSHVEGCKTVDEYNGMCLVCNAFKGYYATDAYYMAGRVYQVCKFKSNFYLQMGMVVSALVFWAAF
jgi:hypothetical protein